MKILVVEDEPALNFHLQRACEQAGFAVDIAFDGETGWHLGDTESYDAVILDLGLPKLDGISILQRWREARRLMPVLILTARGRWSEKMAAFNAGADDYVVKPFETDEVLYRIRALIRRSSGHAQPELRVGPLTLDTNAAKLTREGTPVSLTAQEYRIVSYLMHHPGKVISKSELTEHIYDQNSDQDSNVLEVLIGRIRKKIGADIIQTIRGQGYVIEAPPTQ